MLRTNSPYRADQVGSLLRSPALKAARAAHLSGAALREVEDAEIRALIARQEAIGLEAVTDGEFRRAMWHYDFLEIVDGVEAEPEKELY